MSEFVETLPEEYREAVQSAGIQSLETLVKNWQDAQSALGSSIRVPGKDAPPEALAEFDKRIMERVPGLVRLPGDGDEDGMKRLYASLGAPDAPDKYKFSAVEDLDEGTSKQIGDWISSIAHEASLTNTQADRIYKAVAESTRENTTAYKSALEERTAALKREWGNSYDQRMTMAKSVLAKFAGEEGAEFVEQELGLSGLERNPTLTKALAKIALAMNEDTLVVGQDQRVPHSASELRAQIAEAQGNPAYLDATNPMHKPLVEKVRRLSEELAAVRSAA